MTSCWFQKIPTDEFHEDKTALMTQLGATKWSSKMQFYRGVRSPRTVEDLVKGMKGNHLIWLDEESFVVMKNLPKSVPFFSKFRKASASINFEQKFLVIYGTSSKVVATSLARFLWLKDGGADEVRVGEQFSPGNDPLVPTKFITSHFLKKSAESNPQRRLVLGRGCLLSQKQSVALASHPDPLNVGIACMFEDGGRAFVETLSQRTTDFGTLSAYRSCSESNYYYYFSSAKVFLEVMSGVTHISLKTCSHIFDRSHEHLPLHSKARRLELKIGDPTYCDEIDSLTIVPKAVTLVFEYDLPAHFHKLFLQSSGNLREMGLVYRSPYPPSPAQQLDLLEAITTNQNLRLLEIGCPSVFEDLWNKLLETIWSHGSIRRVVLWVESESVLLNQLDALLVFLKAYNHVDVAIKCHDPADDLADILDDYIEPFRLKNRATALTRESVSNRPAVFGAALTNWADGEFYRINHLLIENVDLLCSLIGNPPAWAPKRRGKRQREVDA